MATNRWIDSRNADSYFEDREEELTGYAEHVRDEATRWDYVSEAFGDRCPRHPGVLRGGGDCWKCEAFAYDTPSTYVGYSFKVLGAEEKESVIGFARAGYVMIVAGVVRLTRKGQAAAEADAAERQAA